MFGRKKKQEKIRSHQQELRKGLLFWLPGGSSRLDVYLDYCVIRCLGKTRMKEKERTIPFTSIRDVVYTPATPVRMACLQLFTKEMPEVKKSYWYAYENNLVVVHPGAEDLAQKVRDDGREYITIYYGADVKEKHAQKAADLFVSICPDADVNLINGGQPVYYYLISAE